MKILINAVNARNAQGGGVQVVNNFIHETVINCRSDVEWFYAVSETMDKIHLEDEFKLKIPSNHYFVYPDQPDFKKTFCKVQRELAELEDRVQPNVVYTMLGPCYFTFKTKEVIKFTQPWVLTANEYAWKTLHGWAKLRMKLQVKLIRHLLKNINYFITQTNVVKDGLVNIMHKPEQNIRVISNVLPAVYQDLDTEHIDTHDNKIHIAAIGAGFHKNLDIIPEVIEELKKKGIDNVVFHLTIKEGSPELLPIYAGLKKNNNLTSVINHGNLKQIDLAKIYQICSFSFLPTVLEVFSASSIEAMFFNLPTVASELPFNTEVMGNSCLYYKPMNAKHAAEIFAKLILDEELQKELKLKMKDRLKEFSDFDKYFNEMVDFLLEIGRR